MSGTVPESKQDRAFIPGGNIGERERKDAGLSSKRRRNLMLTAAFSGRARYFNVSLDRT